MKQVVSLTLQNLNRAFSSNAAPKRGGLMSPGAVFAKIVPTKRLLAIERGRLGVVSIAVSDEYLGTAFPLGTKETVDLENLQRNLDIGALIIVTPLRSETTEDRTFQRALITNCENRGIPCCLWEEASREDFNSVTLQEAIEDFPDGEVGPLKSKTGPTVAFALSRFIRDVVGGWANSFG